MNKLSTGDARTCAQHVDDCPPKGRWLGTVVPKRHAKRAVTRNLIKRQMRMVMAGQAQALPLGLWVLRLKSVFDPRSFSSPGSDALRRSARAELELLLLRAAAVSRARPA